MSVGIRTSIVIVLALLANVSLGAANELHPPVPLLDSAGNLVLDSGLPVSLMVSCDGCHDTAFIAETNSHAWLSDPVIRTAISGNGATGLAYELDVVGFNAAERLQNGPDDLNCLLCHMAEPNYDAYRAELSTGNFDWANTAMLLGADFVSGGNGGYEYEEKAFDLQGAISADVLNLTSATSMHCGRCHGPVSYDTEPLNMHPSLAPGGLGIAGQVFSPQTPAASAMNLAGKENLTEPWDVHAERLVDCMDCHHTPSSPRYFGAAARSELTHLRFDPRVQKYSDYLKKPSHSFSPGARPNTGAAQQEMSTSACTDCHNADAAHAWLPERAQHFSALSCEVCHVPRLQMPGRMMTDWTLLHETGDPVVWERGIEGESGNPASLIEGYQPLLLPGADGLLAPHNVSTTWYWVGGEDAEPVSLTQLQAALLVNEKYRPELIAVLDSDGDGELSRENLRLDTEAKTAAVAKLLVAVGISNPRIEGIVETQAINHSVVSNELALKECASCHSAESRMNSQMLLAGFLPGGVEPRLNPDTILAASGSVQAAGGNLVYKSSPESNSHYIIGNHRWQFGDHLGGLAVIGVVLMVMVHGLLRVRASRQNLLEEQQ